MNDQRKSHSLIVPTKLPNKVKAPTAEVVEGKEAGQGERSHKNALRTSVPDKVRQVHWSACAKQQGTQDRKAEVHRALPPRDP